MLMNEDNYCSNWFFHTREQILCKNHTQNVSEFLSEKKLVYVWLLLLRLYEFMFVWECGNSRRNSLFVVLLLLFFSFRRCRVVAWLRSNLNFLRFCFGCYTQTCTYTYTLLKAHMCSLYCSTEARQGEKKHAVYTYTEQCNSRFSL